MNTTTRISLVALLSATLAACATGSGSSSGAGVPAQVQRSIPVCVGEDECRMKMQAAAEWVAETTGYALAVNTPERIETGGWGMGNHPAVRVNRADIGGGRHWIVMEMDCASASEGTRFSATSCPPVQEATVAFNVAVSAAH